MATAAYRQLNRELDRLRVELLPPKFDPLGNYENKVRTCARAYLILCHAAFESYFEHEARRILGKAERSFVKSGRVTRPLAYLIALSSREFQNFGNETDTIEVSFEKLASAVLRDFNAAIKDNNGIKEANVRRLFGSQGLPDAAFDPLMMTGLNSFGADRGEHAHKSASFITNVIDPETELQRVENLLVDLTIFDSQIVSYVAQIR